MGSTPLYVKANKRHTTFKFIRLWSRTTQEQGRAETGPFPLIYKLRHSFRILAVQRQKLDPVFKHHNVSCRQQCVWGFSKQFPPSDHAEIRRRTPSLNGKWLYTESLNWRQPLQPRTPLSIQRVGSEITFTYFISSST